MEDNVGIIYKITCTETGLSYIGQTTKYIQDHGRVVDGLKKRWRRHLQAADDNGSPIEKALHKYGPQSFTIEPILECSISSLDREEARLIEEHDTRLPRGYNVARYRREHGSTRETDLSERFVDSTHRVLVKVVNRSGVPHHIRVELKTEAGNKRFEFGTGEDQLENGIRRALAFIEPLREKAEIVIDPKVLDPSDEFPVRYSKNLKYYETVPAEHILIFREKSTGMVCVKVSPEGWISWKEKRTFKFIGQQNEKYAPMFVERLNKTANCVIENQVEQ